MSILRPVFVVVTVVVFGCLLLFDTTALLRLAGMCLAGGCGVPSPWIAAGAAVLTAGLVARVLWRRRRPASRKAARASRKVVTTPRRAATPRRAGAKGKRARR